MPTGGHGTAMGMLERAEVRAGETVLVTGASGGVGLALVQLAAARGVEVLAVTGAAIRGDWQMLWLLEHTRIFHGAPASTRLLEELGLEERPAAEGTPERLRREDRRLARRPDP